MKKERFKQLTPLLRKVGMKATLAHLVIIDFIKNSKKPISSQDIIEGIKINIDPATVYRCINKLKHHGLIRQIDLRQNHAQYEFFDMKHHHHIICVHCGKIQDIHTCNIESIHQDILQKSHHFQEIKNHSLEFYGVCKKCNDKK